MHQSYGIKWKKRGSLVGLYCFKHCLPSTILTLPCINLLWSYAFSLYFSRPRWLSSGPVSLTEWCGLSCIWGLISQYGFEPSQSPHKITGPFDCKLQKIRLALFRVTSRLNSKAGKCILSRRTGSSFRSKRPFPSQFLGITNIHDPTVFTGQCFLANAASPKLHQTSL